MFPVRIALCLSLIALSAAHSREQEPVVGGRCEGCDAVFVGLPTDLGPSAQLCSKEEPGERMTIEGTVFDANEKPAAGIILYAYQTDARGHYPPDESSRGTSAYRHGRIRGWVQTDAQGRYRFDTIRPSSYPETTIAAHVHMHVIEVGRCTYYLDDIHFLDDPFLSDSMKRPHRAARGGSGVVQPSRGDDGEWKVRRDVHLGRNVPGYPD